MARSQASVLPAGADGVVEAGHQLGCHMAMTHPGLTSTRGLERFRNQVGLCQYLICNESYLNSFNNLKAAAICSIFHPLELLLTFHPYALASLSCLSNEEVEWAVSGTIGIFLQIRRAGMFISGNGSWIGTNFPWSCSMLISRPGSNTKFSVHKEAAAAGCR